MTLTPAPPRGYPARCAGREGTVTRPSGTRRWAVFGTPTAEEALGVADQLADDLGGRLHACHAADRLSGPVRHRLDRSAHVSRDRQLLEPAHGHAGAARGVDELADDIALEGLS